MIESFTGGVNRVEYVFSLEKDCIFDLDVRKQGAERALTFVLQVDTL